jgi:glycosyltransferase involved in cell wall biosynthesis
MTGQNLFAMFTLGTFCRGRRLLAIHFHHTGVKPLWQWRLIYRVAYRRFGTITFPSDFVRAEAQMIYPKIASLSHTVRNPLQIPEIPSAEEREQARCALGIPKGALVVGNAGWLIPRKRFDIFLQVAEKIGEKVPNAFFIIAGDGPERSRLEALAERLGIKRRVKWLGWQSDLGRFYRSIDVMVFNSDWDAMGLSPLESMAFGIPVVASVVNGGLAEIIDKPEVGYLFKEHNVESLAAVAAMLLQNPFERHAVGLAGRERVAAISDIRAAACWHEQALASGFSTKDDEKL